MFERFYASLWQHPGLLVVVPLVFWFLRPEVHGFYGFYLRLFLVETVLDALSTAPPPLALPASIATSVAIAFVILGDARYFVLVEALCQRGAPAAIVPRLAWARGLLLALVVPTLQATLIQLFPAWFPTSRHTFLVYELLFFAVAAGYHLFAVEPRLAANDGPHAPHLRTWLRRITSFSLAYYALWAAADVVIFAGLDAGYLLRVVPNVLYYGVFLPFTLWSCPPNLRALLQEERDRNPPNLPSGEEHARP